MEKITYINKIVAKGSCKRKKPSTHRIEWVWIVPTYSGNLVEILRTSDVEICCIECGKLAICQQYKSFNVRFLELST